ncbi:MAG: ABC transporter permease, partial [Rhodospirillales bacterium]
MLRTIAARLVDAVPTVLLVLTLVFVALRLLPGDPALVVLGEYATQDQLALFRRQMGLDLPLPQQYLDFLWRMATFDYG